MKKLLLFAFAFSAGLPGVLRAQTYAPVAVSGFTSDVIANGSGTVANSTTTDADGGSFAFVALNYVNPSSISPTSGLPLNGIINSQLTSGLSYQLAPYTGNNSLRIASTGTGTLTFNTPQAADQVYVLATSGSGTSAVTITVNFTDASSQNFTQTVADWFNGAGYAIQGISRVSRATNIIENSATNPRLYQYLLPISAANTGKIIESVAFNKTSTGGVLNVVGISLRTVASTLQTDAGVTSINSPVSGCGLTNQETVAITLRNFGLTPQSNIPVSYTLNNGTPVNEIFAGPLAPNASATYNFTTKANFSALTTYSLEAKTNLTSDQLASNDGQTSVIVLSAPATTPVLSANGATSVCNGTPVTLQATSSPGATYSWFQNGNQITGASAATYTTTIAGNYAVMASLGGCSSGLSTPVAISVNFAPFTPSLTPTGPTSFCTGGSVTLNAFTTAQGASYVWFKNNNVIPGATSATYSATTSGSYTASAVANGCASATATAVTVNATPQPVTPVVSQTGFGLTSSAATGNQWYLNGAVIPNATGRNHTIAANGTYTVISTINGCISVASNAVTITNLGLRNDLAALNANVYPNPSAGIFNLTLPAGKACEITVTDLTGKVITHKTLNSNAGQLDLTKAAKGIYILKLVTDGRTATRKLVVE